MNFFKLGNSGPASDGPPTVPSNLSSVSLPRSQQPPQNIRYQCHECDLFTTGVPVRCVGCSCVLCLKCSPFLTNQFQQNPVPGGPSFSSDAVMLCTACQSDHILHGHTHVHPCQEYLLSLDFRVFISRPQIQTLLRRCLPPQEMENSSAISHIRVKCGSRTQQASGAHSVNHNSCLFEFNSLINTHVSHECTCIVDVRDPESQSIPVKVIVLICV